MPVLECIRFGNKLYCYNEDEKTVSVFPEQRIDLHECPDQVIGKFITRDFDVKIDIKNGKGE
jgi:hypothetical protein